MVTFAAPGLGSVSGVIHLAVRRPYIAAVAAAVFLTVVFANTVTLSSLALVPPPVPAAPLVQHTPLPPIAPRNADGLQAQRRRQNPGRQKTLKGHITVTGLNPARLTNKEWIR